MTDPTPNPRVSNKVSPLAVIIVVILVGIVAVALLKQRHGHHVTPSGATAPLSAPTTAVAPQPTDLPDAGAPRAKTNDGPEAANAGQ